MVQYRDNRELADIDEDKRNPKTETLAAGGKIIFVKLKRADLSYSHAFYLHLIRMEYRKYET